MKSLVLAEKPSVGRELARVLDCPVKGKGYFEGNKYVVTWALGHLVTLAEPEDYHERYKNWQLEDLPILPVSMKRKVIPDTKQQFHTVRALMQRKDIQDLIIATDAGREGELVARWIMAEAHWHKPFKRLWISSQTDQAIREGFARLKKGEAYDALYASAVCRTEADWLIGLNITRALTTKHHAQLSAGRVQTPTLAMIVEREQAIKGFIPQDYWTVRVNFGDYFGDWQGKAGGHLASEGAARAILEKVRGQVGVIRQAKKSIQVEPPPLAYDLTELQRDANRHYGFSAQHTLNTLQGLYERYKLVTYPRTDSRYLTSDIAQTFTSRLNSLLLPAYSELVRPLLNRPLNVGKRLVDNSKVTDHHAVIPTGEPVDLRRLDTDDRKVYDLIVRRFLAVLYPPYRYEKIAILTEAAGEKFLSPGRNVKDLGWRVIYRSEGSRLDGRQGIEDGDENGDTLEDQRIISIHEGEKRTVKSGLSNKHQTKPPKRYTEATLLSAMESPGKFVEDEELREALKRGGLGTPATRAEIIERLLQAGYMERKGKDLWPTRKGIQLVELAPKELTSPELTAQWELKLADIALGKGNPKDFMERIRSYTLEMVNTTIQSAKTFQPDNLIRSKCPQCGQYLMEVNGKRGKYLVCPDRTCGYRETSVKQTGMRCPQCHKRLELRPGKGGQVLVCPGCHHTEKYEEAKKKIVEQRGAGKVNKQLLAKYTKTEELGTSLGDLLKAALEKDSKGEP